MEKMLEIGAKAVNYAQKLGVDEAEIFLYMENFTSVKFVGGVFASRSGAVKGIRGMLVRIAEPWIKKKGIPMITSGIRAGVGIRAVINKAIGFSSVSSLEEKRVLDAVEEAVKIAKVRPPDPNWCSLPEPEKPTHEGGIFDKKISGLDVEEMLQLCVDCCVAAGDFDKKINQAITAVFATSTYFSIVNTRGIEMSDKGTFFSGFVSTKAKSGTEEASSSDFLTSRTFTEDVRSIAISAAQRTMECFGRKPLSKKHVGTVVFENMSWSQLFSTIFAYGISSFNVQENRSILKGKIGKQVAKEDVSIIDDGTLPEGLGTSKIDDEGVPRQKTLIIDKGVLHGFLYDNYSAKREKQESTGNASRRKMFGAAAYANQPKIQPSNLILQPGNSGLESLISEVKDGVLVKGSLIGAFHSNVVTGDFSVTAENVFKIQNGTIVYPLKPCTIAGNFYAALNSIVNLGNDLKSFQNIMCPSVVVEKVVVST
jgi:PmbA protein